MDTLNEYFRLQDGKVQAAREETANMRSEFDGRYDKSRAVFDETIARVLAKGEDLQVDLSKTRQQLMAESELRQQKEDQLARVSGKCDLFQAAAVKFKEQTLKYYQLVEDLKDMIRLEKKWSASDIELQIKQFNEKRKRVRRHMSLSVVHDESLESGQTLFQDEEGSEDAEEFEAKRVKDAENKVIQDIFGGKEQEMSLNVMIEDGGLMATSVRKYHKQVQTDLATTSRGCQTTITLVSRKFDVLFDSNQTVVDLVNEIEFKQKLLIQLTDDDMDG